MMHKAPCFLQVRPSGPGSGPLSRGNANHHEEDQAMKRAVSRWLWLFVAVSLLLGVWAAVGLAESESGCARDQMRTAVMVAAQGLSAQLQGVGDEERITIIRTFVDAVRFLDDQSGYFYVYTYDCVNVAHATQPDLVGQDLSDYRDPNGVYVIRELSAAAKQGGGFVDYVWAKPGEEGQFPKIGYAAPLEGTDMFIGSGVYAE